MKIRKLYLRNLRNHNETVIKPGRSLNFLFGRNGSGKTTILEGISIAGFSKSFLPGSDSNLIQKNENSFTVRADTESDIGIPYWIVCNYQFRNKEIKNSYGENLIPKDIIGRLPIVVLSPDHKNITFGSPQDRRMFLDRLLSQSSAKYFSELLKYRKALKQRNTLLSEVKNGRRIDQTVLRTWTDILIETGSELIINRKRFIEDLLIDFKLVYKEVTENKEKVDLNYSPYKIDLEQNNFDLHRNVLIDQLYQISLDMAEDEFRRGTTLFGPQKDDINILINDGLAREHASQGQHKSLLISLKFAEFSFLLKKRKETPVFLLDDIFSELDRFRANRVFELIEHHKAQTFVTLTEPEMVDEIIQNNQETRLFELINGKVN